MRVQLDEPVLVQTDESIFMIAEQIVINHEASTSQISYCGKVYGYENAEIKFRGDGEWVYDLTENIRLLN